MLDRDQSGIEVRERVRGIEVMVIIRKSHAGGDVEESSTETRTWNTQTSRDMLHCVSTLVIK